MNNAIFDEPNYDVRIKNVFPKGVHEYFMKNKAIELIEILKKCNTKKNLLDVGCGNGEFESLIFTHFDKIVGIDCSKVMIAAAKKRKLRNCSFLTGNALNFQFDERFDFIIFVNVLHHINPKKRLAVLKNAREHLKRYGCIIIFELNPFNPFTWFIVKFMAEMDKNASLISHCNLQKYLKMTGFAEVQTKFFQFFPKELDSLKFTEKYISFIPLGGEYRLVAKKLGMTL